MYFLDGACGGLIDELLGSYGIVNDYECVSVDIHIYYYLMKSFHLATGSPSAVDSRYQ